MSAPFPKLYGSSRWKRRSKLQLKLFPICAMCSKAGRTTEATIAHHVVEHRGDERLFFLGALASVCKQCHLEVHGHQMKSFKREIGIDGWPLPCPPRN